MASRRNMRCGAGWRALERAQFMTGRRHIMARLFFIIPLVWMVSAASAQSSRPDPGCARDVARHCRAVMNDGDTAILSCLKENRAKISKTCEKVLVDHGQ
jgi:Cysteine rich repeat